MIVRTKRQAQGLQRCSTRTCACCDKQGRGFLQGLVEVECWGAGPGGFDESMVLYDTRVAAMVPVCKQHEAATGVFTKVRESGQVYRVVIQ